MSQFLRLGKIAKVASGGTPSRSNPDFWGGKIPWVKTTHIQNKLIELSDIDEFITEEGLKYSSAKLVPQNTILLGMIGQGKTRGQVGYLNFKGCTNQNAATIQPYKQCDSKYLYQFLLSNYKNIRSLSNSSGQGNLNIKLVESIKVYLPPLPEQKAIADILSTWDQAIEKTVKLIAEKEKRFKWLLNELITEKAKKEGWKEVKLGAILKESKIPDKELNPRKRLSVRLHLKGVETREYRGTESEGSTNYFIRKSGQLVYGKQNIFKGAIGIIPDELDGFTSTQDIPTFDIINDVDSKWIFYNFTMPNFYMKLEALTTGSGSKRLHPKELYKIKIPLPCLNDQQKIITVLKLAKKEVDALKDILDRFKLEKQGLMQKLLTGKWRVKV